ncbi:hypothetical protein ACFPAF_06470 [Hymenobacter endophyticus]|uniref:Uncharacterized protein n=1 Tax=Hymenobacter endophyticus TaxID=3076335 RepID=A0ABU3TF98_9BACT|nr:hypothetical protein [Hymenobacter endophyticus]MDU0370029.1 hypothetical protein [Hymenobacter endophyticus]
MEEVRFTQTDLTAEDAFWVMQYFLEENYRISSGTFEVSDILSASEPAFVDALTERPVPIDSGMMSFWNEAIEKYRQQGPPPMKILR